MACQTLERFVRQMDRLLPLSRVARVRKMGITRTKVRANLEKQNV